MPAEPGAGGSRPLVVVMGASGCGKSTVGRELAARLDVPFADADDLHPAANVAAMAAGRPLDDEDRAPWLDAVGRWLAAHPAGGVMACSALRRAYREVLRAHAAEVLMLHLAGERSVLELRVAARSEHFMPASLVASQLATLEPLGADERGATLDLELPVDQLVSAFLAGAGRGPAGG